MTLIDGLNLVAAAIILVGVFFFVAGTIGLLRLPDFFSRMHAVGKCDTLGAMLMLGGLALHFAAHHGFGPQLLNVLKILGIVLFIFLANPTATHAFARSALRSGLQPLIVKPPEDTRQPIPPDRVWKSMGGA